MKRSYILILALYASTTLTILLAGPENAGAQASAFPPAGQGEWVTLKGNTRPEAKAINDRGRVSDDRMLNHLMLQLQRNPEQEQALQQFIKDVHDPASPLFHHWITAAEFGARFGASPASVSQVTDWLTSQGFKVNLIYPNQLVVDFTGSAGQIRRAFRTEIHNLKVNGQSHIANMSDPQIPAALATAVAGVVSLNDFRPHPTLHMRADYAAGDGYALVVPADLATIYNFNPAFMAGISGQGQTVVVVENTNVYSSSDWDTFRSTFGLSTTYPLGSMTQVHPASNGTNNCTDPGYNGDDIEAALDVEWASAAAPSAAIVLASCSDTDTTFGGFIALENLLNASDMPPAVVSISYGESESYEGASYNAYINALYEQGVGEGVSIFVSSGDEGAASSDADAGWAVSGITVSGFTSTPYNVSVGGTDFADTYQGTRATYWNGSNSRSYGSARSYVPEIPWNNSCASVLIADFLHTSPTYGAESLCNKGENLTTGSGSGGPSGCAYGAPDTPGVVSGTCSGYLKPAWQSGFIGNPSDGVRDIPDVSLFSSSGVWGHYYAFCLTDPLWGYSCSGAPDTWAGAGGTSFASPIMAAVQALINQTSGSRWGNPNPSYYQLAATEYASGGTTSCNSALGNAVASNCVFYDVTQLPLLYGGSGTGGDIDVPCQGVNCYAPSGAYGVLSSAPQPLSSVLVSNLGGGYTSAPTCTLAGGGGSGAECSASITGVVSSLALTSGGSGYTYYPISCTLTGGGGSGASCWAEICENNEVCYVGLTGYGSGYTSNPTCTLSGGGGTGATCTATRTLGIATSLTAAGSGYVTMPQCTLTGGGGSWGTCGAFAYNSSDAYQPAFGATTGWDFATGIGTVNVSNLVASFGASAASFSTSGLTFSSQPLYTTSSAESVTLTNTGTANLTIVSVGIGGTNASDFTKTADTCTAATLAINGSCSVSVTFSPSGVGSLGASLLFTDFAPQSPQTVTLSGTGVSVGVELSPTSLTFPDQVAGSSSQAQTVTLTNTGSTTLTLSGIAITGANSSDFSQSHTCGATLGAGAECDIQVSFTPAAPGSKSALLQIADNVLGSPQSVSLAGASTTPVPLVNQTLVPTSAAPGGPAFTLTVNGTGFASGATVRWNGTALATTVVGSGKLTATVPAANIASAGTASISVGYTGSTLTSNVVFFPVTPPATTVLFANASGSPIAVGVSPRGIAVGDFNGDGKLDMAVANEVSNTLTILLGNGDGTFTPAPSQLETGAIPNSIAVGDFNRDGKLDLAVVNAGQSTVTILLGNGDGTFTPANSSPSTGNAPYSVVAGDFNGDGILDLAVANAGSNTVTILLGFGDGTFTPAAASPVTGTEPVAITAGDFNGDGNLDLAVANGDSDTVTILLGNGDGTFTPAAASPATGVLPFAILTGDFNGDGKLDLAVANDSNNLTILLGNGDGTFTAAASPATGSWPFAIAMGDFNGDGKLDIAVADAGASQVSILLGNGDGTFTPVATSPATGSEPMAIAVGDFNGDGGLDLATANTEANNVSVLLQSLQAAVAGASPSSLTFSNQSLGSTSTSQPVTLNNTGNAALIIASITTTGDFSQTNNCADSVAASGSCTINVTFSPTATGTRPGTLTVTDNSNLAPGSTQTVTLTGTGVNPVPGITSLSPTAATAGAAGQTLTINGTNFVSTSTVTYNGASHTASFVSATQLTISLSTSDQATAGTYAVVVTNPTPGGGASRPVNFTVNNPVPGITSLSPTSATAGATSQTLTINGTNFVSTSTVTYNGASHTASFVSATQLTITLSASDQAAASTCAVVVTNPAPGGGASSLVNFTVNNPVPAITSLSPASVTAGAAGQTLTINGTNFVSTSTVTYNGASHTASFVSATHLTITLSASDQATAGTYAVVVTNPTPGGGASGPVNFTVNNPAPGITSLSPTSATAGATSQTLTINGTNFVSTSTVTYNGAARTVNSVSPTQLTITLSTSDQATAGTYAVVMTNPTPGGGTSSAVNFTVNNPVPGITNLSPAAATAGASSQTLTINGTNFVSTSTVTYNGASHAATIVSPTQLTITLSASDQVTAGSYAVAVTNPAPGGGASSPVNFTVNNPVPGITNLSPTSATAGAASQTLTINGTNFVSTSTVTYNGAAHTASFVSSTQLTITLSTSDEATAGNYAVLVTNPAPGGGASSPLSFTILGPAVSLSPSSLTYAAQSVGNTSTAQTITLTNTGNAPLMVSAISTNADFPQTSPCVTTLSAGARCTISVTFSPQAAGSRTSNLSVYDNAPASPQSVALSGTGQDFSLASAPGSSTSVTVAPGQPANYTLNVGGEGGMAGTVSFTCSGAPSGAACSVSPNPVTAGSSASNVTVTVTTTAPAVSAPRSRLLPPGPPLSPGLRGLWMRALMLAAVAWALRRRKQCGFSRWPSPVVPLAVGLLLTLTLAGCGGEGGGGGGGGGTPPNPGTPSGTYTLTVTGTASSGSSSSLSHSTTLSLTVS
jgi:hypothetical protein